MAVRLYIGGTAGNKDGELISNGDMSNPITFDGYDIETGDVSYAQFAKAYLRADEGEEWVGVCLKIADISGTEDLHDILIIGQKCFDANMGQLNKVIYPNMDSFILEGNINNTLESEFNTFPGSYYTIPYFNGAYTLYYPYINDVNSEDAVLYISPLLYMGLKDPNTSIKIIMTGGAKNE